MMLFFDGEKKGRKKYRVERSADIFDADIGPSFFSRSLTFARTFEKTTRFPGFDAFLAPPRSSRQSEKVPRVDHAPFSRSGEAGRPEVSEIQSHFSFTDDYPVRLFRLLADPVPSWDCQAFEAPKPASDRKRRSKMCAGWTGQG